MARAKFLLPIDGAVVVTSHQTGKRYVFTADSREQPIDDADVPQFDARVVVRKPCDCGGQDGRGERSVKVFDIIP